MSETTTVKYRPSNGTDGAAFMANWCGNCARDKTMREGVDIQECNDSEICQIIGNTMLYGIDDINYPTEWIYEDGRPTCTAFSPAGEPIPLKDDKTVDMFTEKVEA